MDLTELSARLRARDVTSEEVVRGYLDRIKAYDGMLNSYITVCADEALDKARATDRRRASSPEDRRLSGVPIAIKDLIATKGVRTTAGSTVLAQDVPAQDATVWRRLAQEGAILLGKLNLHEFAYGPTGENPHYGPAHNPWNVSRIAGGSSGGSAAAVAADLTPASIGTDTGGSIRIPAACTGTVGLKPTYGLVSKAGVAPLAFTLDHVGPMTRSVRDAALLLQILAGVDELDPTTRKGPSGDYAALIGNSVTGLRVGFDERFFLSEIAAEVALRTEEAVSALREAGAVIKAVELPLIDEVARHQNVIISSEALAVHDERLHQHGEMYGDDVRERLEAGRIYSGMDYARAHEFRLRFTHGMARVFADVDAILSPTLPFAATPIGERHVQLGGGQHQVRAALTRFTHPFNLAGLPALSVPCGLSTDGLPIGIQLIGPWFAEATLFQLGAVLEEVWPFAAPPLFH
ncbi:MAG: amidase [Bacilli bacterium]